MVVRDLPLIVLVDVNEGITSLDLIAGGAHGEFVDTSVLAPVVSNGDVTLQNLSLGLLLQESNEVILDQIVIRSGNVGDCGKQDGLASVPVGDLIGILGGQGRVP